MITAGRGDPVTRCAAGRGQSIARVRPVRVCPDDPQAIDHRARSGPPPIDTRRPRLRPRETPRRTVGLCERRWSPVAAPARTLPRQGGAARCGAAPRVRCWRARGRPSRDRSSPDA